MQLNSSVNIKVKQVTLGPFVFLETWKGSTQHMNSEHISSESNMFLCIFAAMNLSVCYNFPNILLECASFVLFLINYCIILIEVWI